MDGRLEVRTVLRIALKDSERMGVLKAALKTAYSNNKTGKDRFQDCCKTWAFTAL